MPGSDDGGGSEDEEVWSLLAGSAAGEEGAAAPAAAPRGRDGGPEAAAAPGCCGQAEGARACTPAAPPAASVRAEPPGTRTEAPGPPPQHQRTRAAEPEHVPSSSSTAGRAQRLPAHITGDPELNAAIAKGLPKSHNFEVHRTVWRLRRFRARHAGLQFPEGLQQWALTLADILRRFVPSLETTTIMGDVSFGACCIDDLGARAVGVDFLVHYGHSCIVPTDQTTVSTLYVHVEVDIDSEHLAETVRHNFAPNKRLAFMTTVQFTPGVVRAVEALKADYCEDSSQLQVPQVKPLSLGETLGCTSPLVDADMDAVVFVCDGRFHLESAMIQNPGVKGGFYRYDPFYLTLTRESFAHEEMHRQRQAAIAAAKQAKLVGLILSTLGRQGSSGVLEGVERLLDRRGVPHLTVLLADVSPERLEHFQGVGAWVQVACPRLSIDWGEAFKTPLLTPYEAHVAFGDAAYEEVYPMDYYSNRGGPWSNYGAHNGHGGSLDAKFRHLGRRRLVEYEDGAS